jgi:hypothetical protein
MSTLLWLTDRSRYEAGLDGCPRERFLGYHFGPFGYGIARRAQSIPLSTGIAYHDLLAPVLRHVAQTDELPPDEVIRAACAAGITAYRELVEVRGLAGLDEGERLDEIIAEQETLIQGLVWAFSLTTLPWIHSHSKVLEVEREGLVVLGCTCGLGDRIGDQVDHEARDCAGVGWQSRADFVTEYRDRPDVVAMWDFKGSAYGGFADDWETKIQFTMTALDIQERLGKPVSEAWIVELLKGRREGRDYDPATKSRSGPMIQNSGLCYWYRREGNPPMDQPDWQEQYEWVGEDGKGHRLGNNYRKAGLWTIAEDMPELRQAGISIPEFAAKFIPVERLGRHVSVVGPLQIHQIMLGQLSEEILAEERRWQGVVWELYDVLQNEAQGDWTSEAYQAALRRLVPRNFSRCRRFGKRYECQMATICHEREGWKDPLGVGGYVHRAAHHEPERAQQVARGLVVEPGLSEGQEER